MKTINDKIEELTERIIDICKENKNIESDEFVNMIKWTVRAAVYYGQRVGANQVNKQIAETSENKERIKPIEIIELVKRLPDAKAYITEDKGKFYISDGWLIKWSLSRLFEGDTLEEAAEKMIDYLYSNMNFNSLVGQDVKFSGFPDLKKVEVFCLNRHKS